MTHPKEEIIPCSRDSIDIQSDIDAIGKCKIKVFNVLHTMAIDNVLWASSALYDSREITEAERRIFQEKMMDWANYVKAYATDALTEAFARRMAELQKELEAADE